MQINSIQSFPNQNFFSLSDLEIDQELIPIFEKINNKIKTCFTAKNTFLSVSQLILKNIFQSPVKSLFKIVFFAYAGYIEYFLIKGSFAGIEVDFDSNFSSIFSSDSQTRLAQGLNLTNGDQAGQFMMDSCVVAYITYQLVVKEHYEEFAASTINNCYGSHLRELMNSLDKSKHDQNINESIRQREKINRLYKHLEKSLEAYGRKPDFYELGTTSTNVQNKVINDIQPNDSEKKIEKIDVLTEN